MGGRVNERGWGWAASGIDAWMVGASGWTPMVLGDLLKTRRCVGRAGGNELHKTQAGGGRRKEGCA